MVTAPMSQLPAIVGGHTCPPRRGQQASRRQTYDTHSLSCNYAPAPAGWGKEEVEVTAIWGNSHLAWGHSSRGHEDIGRLDVAMDDVLTVQVLQPAQDPRECCA